MNGTTANVAAAFAAGRPETILTCRKCHMPVECIAGTYVVMWSGTTADGLSYCPPNPDHLGRFGNHVPAKCGIRPRKWQ